MCCSQASSLLQLIQMSRLIVDATVLSRLPTVDTSRNPQHPVLLTDSVMAVHAVLAGTIPNGSADIVIEQTGGDFGDWHMEAEGDPLVSAGERYILSLIPDDRPEPPNTTGLPRYGVLGVWSGKIKVSDGKVAFAPGAHRNLHAYDGTDVAAFLPLLREMIARPYTGADTHLPIHPTPRTNQ